jgi:hypothetical protein
MIGLGSDLVNISVRELAWPWKYIYLGGKIGAFYEDVEQDKGNWHGLPMFFTIYLKVDMGEVDVHGLVQV